jgi:hypothetical protein
MIEHITMKTIKNISFLTVLCTVIAMSCSDETFDPVLKDSSTFEPPVFESPATTSPAIFTEENLGEVYEVFKWKKTDYGVSLSTNYVLEVDDDSDFDAPKNLATTSANEVSVSKEAINNAMLALGLPAFEESTVHLRVRSTINGIASDTLYSAAIARTATTFQSSECGSFCTIGIIGDATAGGWDKDIDLRLADATKADKETWTAIVYLTGGKKVKFRASDGWDTNWGATDFPEGTGTQGGPDIPITTSGYYKVVFSSETGAYTFTGLTTPEYATVGIIGSGTPGGWGTDTDLTKDPGDPHVWTGTVTLTDGEAKFRALDAWDVNWGAGTYPSGFGIGNGPNIPVKAGTYFVRLNDATGEYAFMPANRSTPYAKLGIIGSATSGGWDTDTDLVANPSNPYVWSKIITVNDGESKFRADDGWDVNWGASDFPGGIGTSGGPNIPTKNGTYFVTFNTGTGEYYFLK